MTDEVASKCQKCGASVYKQHIDSGIARYEGGTLMCAHCCAEYERDHDASSGGASSDFEAITLDGDDDMHRKASRMGASAFLTKPFRLRQIEELINELTAKAES